MKGSASIAFLLWSAVTLGQVRINEYMSLNSGLEIDGIQVYVDWLEIYNYTSGPIDLQGWYLSDDEEELDKWSFPDTTIQAGGFLLILCDLETDWEQYLNCDFAISSEGEDLLITDSDQNIVDAPPPVELKNDVSLGRNTDGGSEFIEFFVPTPGFSNAFGQEEVELDLIQTPGFYQSPVHLEIETNSSDVEVYYSLNGSHPHPDSVSSLLYSAPVYLDKPDVAPFSTIPTIPEENGGYYVWQAPATVPEAHVAVRARAFKNGVAVSRTESGTYFIDQAIHERHTLPVMAIIVDSMEFFSIDTGIYVPCTRHIPGE